MSGTDLLVSTGQVTISHQRDDLDAFPVSCPEHTIAHLTTIKPRLGTIDTRSAKPPPKTADAELQTTEHRVWRAEVLKRAGWKCQGPGCDKHGRRGGVRLYADHIVERQDGGALLDPSNGQALCGSCHTLKTAQERARRR